MDRHGAVAVVLAAGVLLEAGSLAIPGGPASSMNPSEGKWMDSTKAGKPLVVPADSVAASLPLDPVRGLLFFQKMNLQTASEADLSSLPGISDSVAGRIVALRDQIQRPLNWTDLDNINGIGEKTLLTIQEYVRTE